ncbi:MAG: glycosyltransferase family 39 protein [Planctomycetota bacterium]|nr:glycosyltransferase family 39 protein [Planctomycetota bacterium]
MKPPAKWAHGAALAAVLIGSFLLKLHHLNHPGVKPLDEVFHAIVARNFLHHPLTPTLVDHPYAPYDYRNWRENYIWLHKPPVAMWQIALSFAVLGVNTLALRLPSAILSTLAAGLTYLIGAELLDRTTGLIAATLQAFNPVILMLLNGYVFSDHVDIALLFWTEFGIYFLCRSVRTGRWMDLSLCGIGQGVAFLSKSYPALIVLGIAVVAWLLPRTRLLVKNQTVRPRFSSWSMAIILFVAGITALPWTFYTAIRFTDEFRHENLGILSHLDQNVEGWAAPWDRVMFDYWISIFHVFYPACLAAMIVLAARAYRQRQLGLWLIFAWALGVIIPNLLATSKTMSSTLIAWPAIWLLLGHLISLAIAGDLPSLGTWMAAALLAFSLHAKSIPAQGWGYASPGIAVIMRQHVWVFWQVLAAIITGALAAKFTSRAVLRRAMLMISIAASLVLALRWWRGDHPRGYGIVAWEVTRIDNQSPDFSALAAYVSKMPANAAFIVDEHTPLDNKLMEFAVDRSCYSLIVPDWRIQAIALGQGGAVPYLVSATSQSLPVLFVDRQSNYTVYQCAPESRPAPAK